MLDCVSTATGTNHARAETIVRAFLETLMHLLPNEETEELVAQLPEELKHRLLAPMHGGTTISSYEFLIGFARLAGARAVRLPEPTLRRAQRAPGGAR